MSRRRRRLAQAPTCLAAVVILCGTLGFGCASQDALTQTQLPFRVAVVPVQTSIDRTIDVEESLDDKLEMQLAIDAHALSDAFARELQAECFTQADVLPYPSDVDPATFANWPAGRQAQWWEAAARTVGADIILESTLVYSPHVEVHDNSLFWPNFVLFGLGGPFCYFLADQSYFVDARLRARLIDLNPIYDGRVSLQDGRSQLLRVQPEFKELSLSLIDRADEFGSYALSFVVPASFVSLDDEGVLLEVQAGVVEGLGDALVKQLRDGSDSVVTADRLFPFHCNPNDVQIARRPDGEIGVRGDVLLRRGKGVESMDQFQIEVGDALTSGDFEEGRLDEDLSTPTERYYRYTFEGSVRSSSLSQTVKVTLWDGSRERNTRSFTFPIRAEG